MKIIGKTDGGYIIEASEYEVSEIVGIDKPWGRHDRLSVGASISISEMAKWVRAAVKVKSDLSSSLKTLRACADLVEATVAVVKEPEKPEAPADAS